MTHTTETPGTVEVAPSSHVHHSSPAPPYPGLHVTCNGNQLVTQYVETRITEGGVFYPITPSTEGGEIYQQSFAQGELNVFGRSKIAIECEGEHAAQGGATAFAVAGHRTVNFTSGQGIVYAMEQYYHAPGKLSTMVLEIGARALTKHALNVHCGHDDFYAALDTGWTMLVGKDAQQAADQAIILRKVNELSLNPGMNIQDGMLTTHSERTYLAPEAELLREFLGAPDDLIECPTPAQRELFGPRRRRVPAMMDLRNPVLLGPVQNQEHHMNGVVARRNHFNEPILKFLEQAYAEFGRLTGRFYGLLTEYRTEDAETVFISLGCAAENIEAAVDYLREQRGARVGSIHVNVIRPFPEAAIINALRGKQHAIILERTDEGMAGDNPLARDIRTALSKGQEARRFGGPLPELCLENTPRLFRGVYGIGSRDFRPEHTLGAYEFATGQTRRQDGRGVADGESYFVLGVDHPCAVISKDRPSLLPEKAIAVRFHSIGGWGMITTGKNLGAILGEFSQLLSEAPAAHDDASSGNGNGNGSANGNGQPARTLYVMANPKYGSEKKGAPTNYYLVVAPERIRVNCELNHVDVVLCCDPKAFTHTNPLEGLKPGGCLVWESSETPETAWQRIPARYRQFVREHNIRVFLLPGFDIARQATERGDLQLRMQGNSFLGAFFRVSSFLRDHEISEEAFYQTVRQQYKKKFGRFGDAVVESNMKVMEEGFRRVQEIHYGELEAPDRSSMRSPARLPFDAPAFPPTAGCASSGPEMGVPLPAGQAARAPLQSLAKFDGEFRHHYGYHQPSSALASVGIMAAGTGATQSKYVARRETPVYIAENCTQCMECITACPDTALPNAAQEISVVLRTAARHYVSEPEGRKALLLEVPGLEQRARARMNAAIEKRETRPFKDIIRDEVAGLTTVSETARTEFLSIMDQLPLAYSNVPAIFRNPEKKTPGAGGIFSIFVSDLCKGCGECVQVCGDHDALRMTVETEDLNARHMTAQVFSRLLPDTPQKFLGLYHDGAPQSSREAALRNHLMVRRNYEALVSGDGACAGCGEKSILRAAASVTEAYMRPLYHAKADRLRAKAERLEREGVARLQQLRERNPTEHGLLVKSVAHTLFGLGGENDEDTARRMAAHGPITDAAIVDAVSAVMRLDAFNHSQLQSVDGRWARGMSVMYMGASTGCNTVYGSTPPSNPHPYPWMNSLFQDGPTIGWLLGESLILQHARRSVVPERLCDALLEREANVATPADYFTWTHLDDALMTEQEIKELPKLWIVGGDGALGDIGFQNASKVILQNRPNVKILMLDTQVYSNTGGQNSDSSTMLGGYDMNQFGLASQGKLIEKKSVAEAFTSGHGSPFVAQVSMANAARLYRAMLDGLEYRGTAFFQCYTTCQPEHGVSDHMSADQAKLVRDARGMPEFVFNPRQGETSQESFDLKGNPSVNRDWWETQFKATGEKYNFTVAHWALTEGRFRKHLKSITEEQARTLVPLDDILIRLTQDDVVQRRVFNPAHRSFVPDFGVVIRAEVDGKLKWYSLSRQLVLFCVERRKSWRMLQSKAGVVNKEYLAQKALLKKVDAGQISVADVQTKTRELFLAELTALG